jgi:hypothetical protein
MALNAQKIFETGNGFQIVLTFKLTGMSLDFTLSQVSSFTSKSLGGGVQAPIICHFKRGHAP